MKSFTVDKNIKLSRAVSENLPDLTYNAFMKVLRLKDVKVNGKRVNKDIDLIAKDVVEVYYSPLIKLPYSVIYGDENVLVIDKCKGVSSEQVYSEILKEYKTAKFIHRLDTNTVGVMVFALNGVGEKELLFGFKNRAFDKIYLAEVYGFFDREEGVLEGYLLKDKNTATVKVFSTPKKGATAIKTGYKVVKKLQDTCIVKVKLYTGKTHQIRAQFAHVNHFVIGDGKYGDNAINRQKKAKSQRLISSEITLRFAKESPLYYLDGKTFLSNFKLENL